MSHEDEIKDFVKKRYGGIVKGKKRTSCCCCGEGAGQARAICGEGVAQARAIGYTEDEVALIPPEAVAIGMGCGNPAGLADISEGEVVLDLGSGGGVDVFLAACRVGKSGRVIGVDMTDEMIETAGAIAEKHGYGNVEFRKGDIEKLPVEDDSIDLAISNCVVNLASDKFAVFREVSRVLKPGGRFVISDLVTDGPLPDDVRRSFEAWADCIAGALERQEYLDTIKRAGFEEVAVIGEDLYTEPCMDERLVGKIISLQVKATKRTR